MPLALKGDPVRGQALAETCAGCHAIPGYRNVYPSYRVPKLGGQSADYLEVALQRYRNGDRPHTTMQGQAAALTDQDIADVVAYVTQVEGTPERGISSAGASEVQAGKAKAATCAACHGAEGHAAAPQWPHLAGQHASYLVHALKQYKAGVRSDPMMAPMVAPLTDQDIEDLAAYFAAQPGLYTLDR